MDDALIPEQKTIINLIEATNMLAEAYKVVIGLIPLEPEDKFYGIEALLRTKIVNADTGEVEYRPLALEEFRTRYPRDAGDEQEGHFALRIKPSGLVHDVDEYGPMFGNLSNALKYLKKYHSPQSVNEDSADDTEYTVPIPDSFLIQAYLKQAFRSLSDIQFQAMACAKINDIKSHDEWMAEFHKGYHGEEDGEKKYTEYTEQCDRVNRRKDVLQILLDQMSRNLVEIREIALKKEPEAESGLVLQSAGAAR